MDGDNYVTGELKKVLFYDLLFIFLISNITTKPQCNSNYIQSFLSLVNNVINASDQQLQLTTKHETINFLFFKLAEAEGSKQISKNGSGR